MKAKDGDTVRIHYTLKDDNGQTVETTRESDPIEFTLGGDRVISGFNKEVNGMELNEKKTVVITPEDAYGTYDKEKVFEYLRKNAPGDFDPRIGDAIQLHRPNGRPVLVTVLERTEQGFMMDANHPLAGKKLTFDLELVEIVEQEI